MSSKWYKDKLILNKVFLFHTGVMMYLLEHAFDDIVHVDGRDLKGPDG